MNPDVVGAFSSFPRLHFPSHRWNLTSMSMFGFNSAKQKDKNEVDQRLEAIDDKCKKSLRSIIESQIIPRLLQANRTVEPSNANSFDTAFEQDATQVEVFAELCVQPNIENATNFVKQLQREGVSNDDIFLKLMAPAARCLGTWWEDDKTNFVTVTLGLMHMQQLTHELGYDFHQAPQNAGTIRRVMLASAPGSQHVLGLAMVSEFFRKDGWQVVVEIANTEREVLQASANEWFDLIGLSVGIVEQIPTLGDLINRVKKSSRNPDTPVILGGPAFLNTSVSAESLGASGISSDAIQGLKLASALVDLLKRPSF
jgi:methanogenic corrinoid protein MtbC1